MQWKQVTRPVQMAIGYLVAGGALAAIVALMFGANPWIVSWVLTVIPVGLLLGALPWPVRNRQAKRRDSQAT